MSLLDVWKRNVCDKSVKSPDRFDQGFVLRPTLFRVRQQHFAGVLPRGAGDVLATQHPRQLVDALHLVQRLDAADGAAVDTGLADLPVLARTGRHLWQVRDAQHLVAFAQLPQ